MNLRVAVLIFVWAQAALGQGKISLRLSDFGGSSYLVVLAPGADPAAAREEIGRAGFQLVDHPDLRPNHLLVSGNRSGVSRIADLSAVSWILPASADLVARRRVIACGGAIGDAAAIEEYVEAGRGWPRDPTGGIALVYVIQSLSARLDPNAARQEIDRAFREWQKYARVTVTEGNNSAGARTIAIRFASRAHGDLYPFDGPSGTLAHTFYPPPLNPEPSAGDIHLDAEEDWHVGSRIDLYSVALHEIGHALGLGHTDQPGAVMYPYYRQASELTADDIAGIQDIYGAPGAATPTAPVMPPSTPVTPPASVPPPQPSAPDRTPPTLRITSPASTNISTGAATLALSGTASDDRGVGSVRWITSSGDSGVASGTTSWSATAPLYVGTTVVTVRAYDAAGNSSWRSVTVTRR